MATLTKTQTKSKVETSEAPATVVDKGLIRLVQSWKKADADSSLGWIHIAQYVVQNETITNKELIQVLREIRGLTESSAKSEASRFMRIRKSDEAQVMLDRALKGDKSITVYDLRSAKIAKKVGDDEEDDEETTLQKKLDKKLETAARFGIKEGLVETAKEFGAAAQEAFRVIQALVEAKAAKTSSDGDEEETTEEGEEEE
jgi:hypothetical protein